MPRRYGGRCEIRTHEDLATLPVFKTGAFNRSANLPSLNYKGYLSLTVLADLAAHLHGKLFDATSEELALLTDACERHSLGLTKADVTIQTCWDADRLDLGRVGIKPHPKYLCTAAAKASAVIQAAFLRSNAADYA